MKKILLCLALVSILMPQFAMAQETEGNVEPKEIYTHSWRDNWYIQLGAGAQMPLFEKTPNTSNFDMDKTTAVYEAAFGHWWSPYFGFRFRGQGGALHWDDYGWNKAKYANLNLDIQWDMFNTLGGVNEKRVFSILPYIGLGGTYAWDYAGALPGNIKDNEGKIMEHQGAVNATFGLEFRFRCSKRVDLYVDARMTGTSDNINNLAWKTGVDPIFSLTGGLKINLGKNGRHVTKYVPYDCSGEIKKLNDEINNLRGELADKDARLRAAEAQLPCLEVKEVETVEQKPAFVPAVRFTINSAKVSRSDKVTLYDVAKYMNENEDVKVVINGYADKKTGTAEYNKALSERRANAVKKILVENGVDESRMTINANGGDAQPYADTNNWNRVVLINIQ